MKAIGVLSLATLLALAVVPAANASGLEKVDGCYYLLVGTGSYRLVCPDPLVDEVGDAVDELGDDVGDILDGVNPGIVSQCVYTDRDDYYDPVFCYSTSGGEVCLKRDRYNDWVCAPVVDCSPVSDCVPCDQPLVTECTGPLPDVPDVPDVPEVNLTYMAPFSVPVPYTEKTVGYSTYVAPRTVGTPSVTAVPARDPTYVGTTPAVGGRTCGPSEVVCVNLPNVLDPVPVVVPGNGPVVIPAQSVTVGGKDVGAFVTIGAGATVYVPGGSVGPYSVADIVDLCNQGCAYPGTPSVTKTYTLDYDLLAP